MIPASPGEIALSIGAFSLQWYGIALAVAAIVGVAIVLHLSGQIGLKRDDIVDLSLWTVIAGFIGARLYHVWNEWWYYKGHLQDIWKVWEGGLAIHGGILFGLALIFIISREKKLPFMRLLDISAIGLIAGQAIGRIGNYFNQELFGKPTTIFWAVTISPEHRPGQYLFFDTFHPLFLYEIILNGILFLTLWLLWKKYKNQTGLFLSLYLMGYGSIRFSLDFLRFGQFSFGPLTVAQWMSIGMMFAGLYFLWYAWKREKSKPKGHEI